MIPPFVDLLPGERRMRGLPAAWLIMSVALLGLLADLAAAQDRTRAAPRRKSRSKGAAAAQQMPDRTTGARDGDDRVAGDQSSGGSDSKEEKNGGAPLTLRDVIAYAEPSRVALQEVKDYTAVFTKAELIKGRLVKQVMDMKFRTKPFSVYFRYRSGSEEGRQAIFVEGKFGNRLVVKDVGIKAIAGRMYFKLDEPIVMAENRHPVTHVGIGNLLNTALTVWERESRVEAAEIDVKFFPKAKLAGIPCEAVQLTYLKPHSDLKYHLVRVYFEKDSKLPVHAERFGWPRRSGEQPPLLEDYTYTNLKINQQLGDGDFDPVTYGF